MLNADAIAAATKVLDDFMAAFNARDLAGWEKTFNFPSVRLASNTLVIIEPGYHKAEMFERGALKDWHHSAWERRNVIHAGSDRFTSTRASRAIAPTAASSPVSISIMS